MMIIMRNGNSGEHYPDYQDYMDDTDDEWPNKRDRKESSGDGL
jgi:hypothetical protein